MTSPTPPPGAAPSGDQLDAVWVWPIVASALHEETGRTMWLPMLLAEHPQTLVQFSGDGRGPVDLLLAEYARRGMAPLASPLYDEPPTCPDWQVTLPSAGDTGRIVHSDGLVLTDDLSAGRIPPEFLTAVAVNEGHCALLVTTGVGMIRYKRDRSQGGPDGLMHALTDAGAAGRLVGCLAPVVAPVADRPPVPPTWWRPPRFLRPPGARGAGYR